jgi:hypothetical protein
LLLLGLAGGVFAAPTTFTFPGDEDLLWVNDLIPPPICLNCFYPRFAGGDYNGDGVADLAVGLANDVVVLPGGAALNGGTVHERALLRVHTPGFVHSLAWSDLNSDGRVDLAIGTQGGGFYTLFGATSTVRRDIDVGVSTADIQFVIGGPSNVSAVAGDFNGDGFGDIAVSAPYFGGLYKGAVFFVLGSPTPTLGVVNPQTAYPWVQGPAPTSLWGAVLGSADVNGDGIDDLLATDYTATSAARLNVIRGQPSLPAFQDLAVSPPPLRLTSSEGNLYVLGGGGDMDADGREDIVLSRYWNSDPVRTWIVPGIQLSGTGSIALSTSSFHEILPGSPMAGPNASLQTGDIDGDGRRDVMIGGLTTWAALSIDAGGDLGAYPPQVPSMSAAGVLAGGLADLNGDGRQDMVFYREHDGVNEPGFGGVYVVYGYRPLRHPTVALTPRPGTQRSDLTLTVEGDPAMMRLSGDIQDAVKDRWIPYARDYRVTWTSAEGAKTVRVTFRTSGGRESETAEAQSTLTAGAPGVRPVTNRVGGGRVGRWVVSLPTGGHLKVRVYDASGVDVATVEDADRGAGIWTVEWDGTNGSGRRVAPGAYQLKVERPEGEHWERFVVTTP